MTANRRTFITSSAIGSAALLFGVGRFERQTSTSTEIFGQAISNGEIRVLRSSAALVRTGAVVSIEPPEWARGAIEEGDFVLAYGRLVDREHLEARDVTIESRRLSAHV